MGDAVLLKLIFIRYPQLAVSVVSPCLMILTDARRIMTANPQEKKSDFVFLPVGVPLYE